MGGTEGLSWRMEARAIQYDPDTVAWITARLGHEPSGPELRELEAAGVISPDRITEADGNLVTTAGLNRITSLIIGAGGQALTNSRLVVGVGDGSTAAALGDTDLSAAAGSTHRWIQGVDASYPTQNNGVITVNSTFQSADGAFTWSEWAWGVATAAVVPSSVWATATTSGIMVNHKIQSLGAKATGSVFTHQATLTLS